MDATSSPALDLDGLADRIATTAATLDAATHGLLRDLRAFDERGGWAAQGALSCAHWLSFRCGIGLGAAREKVRVAKALGGLPLIDDELRRGRLSFSKVRALTRVATAENEATLAELARGSTAAQLERICRLLAETRPQGPAVEEQRWVRTRETAGGFVRLEAQLLPEEAARVMAAINSFAPRTAERADGLVALADASLRGDKPDRPPTEVTVHIDAATLTGHTTEGAGVSAETSRRLLCDAGVVPILEDGVGQPLSVGRKLRLFAGALRRALLARDGHSCRFPGCANARYLHAHHVRHWLDGGETCLDNAVSLCTRHHRLVHEGGFTIVATSAGPRFLRPDGRDVSAETHPTPHRLPTVPAAPTWDGDPVDYDAILSCLSP
jgi:hypothetical protein